MMAGKEKPLWTHYVIAFVLTLAIPVLVFVARISFGSAEVTLHWLLLGAVCGIVIGYILNRKDKSAILMILTVALFAIWVFALPWKGAAASVVLGCAVSTCISTTSLLAKVLTMVPIGRTNKNTNSE